MRSKIDPAPSERPESPARRQCLLRGLALCSLPLLWGRVRAELPRLDESAPQAEQLGYRHDVSMVDLGRFPKAGQGDQTCANCRFFFAEQSGWGQCTVFPNTLVNGKGWCSAWAPNLG